MEGIPLTLKDLVNPPPMMPWREFANWIRMSEDHDTARGWMRDGNSLDSRPGAYRQNVASAPALTCSLKQLLAVL